MSVLEDISQKFYNMLTTDARPDPPRINNSSSNNGILNNEIQDLTSNQSNSTNNHLMPLKWFQFFHPKNSSKSKDKTNTKNKPRDKKYRSTKKESNNKNIVNYNIINSNGVKIGANTTYICNIQSNPGRKSSDNDDESNVDNKKNNENKKRNLVKEMPDSVKSLSMSTDQLSLKDMFLIKTHLGYHWQNVFKSLDYSQGQIDQFEERYKSKGIGEMIYQLLIDWKQANGKDANIGIIVKVLWQQQQYECAERLCSSNSSSE